MARTSWNIGRSLAAGAALLLVASASAHATTVNFSPLVVYGQSDLYNAASTGPTLPYDGMAPVALNVTGLSSISFSVSTGNTVVLNTTSGDTYNDADGVGSAPSSSFNTGGGGIAGLTAPNAGFLSGAFEGATVSLSAPAALDFSAGTSFASLSPQLQQAFFIGDGLTGDATGAVQTFYVPTGATTLYLGISDACGYNGGPSCYGDNDGSFTVAATGMTAMAAVGGVPEPTTWALSLVGLGLAGAALRRKRDGKGASAVQSI